MTTGRGRGRGGEGRTQHAHSCEEGRSDDFDREGCPATFGGAFIGAGSIEVRRDLHEFKLRVGGGNTLFLVEVFPPRGASDVKKESLEVFLQKASGLESYELKCAFGLAFAGILEDAVVFLGREQDQEKLELFRDGFDVFAPFGCFVKEVGLDLVLDGGSGFSAEGAKVRSGVGSFLLVEFGGSLSDLFVVLVEIALLELLESLLKGFEGEPPCFGREGGGVAVGLSLFGILERQDDGFEVIFEGGGGRRRGWKGFQRSAIPSVDRAHRRVGSRS